LRGEPGRWLAGAVIIAALGACASTATARPAAATVAVTTRGICVSSSRPRLAGQLSAGIVRALRGRSSSVGLAVDDRGAGLVCQLAANRRFDTASVVKATILAALLRERAREDERLTVTERDLAARMITESDNDAASDLWARVGPSGIRRFLDAAHMTETVPGPGGYWGLTKTTARDQIRLLRVLTSANPVLDAGARAYELSLMAGVEPDQRWGISSGVPRGATVELKNGWLPLATAGWRINSIGCVSGRRASYCAAVLTDDNPTMAYGITTIDRVAEVINGELGPASVRPVPVRRPS
jgi:beta-lactamase class A